MTEKLPFWYEETRPDKIKRNCRRGRHVPVWIMHDFGGMILCQNCTKILTDKDYEKFWGKSAWMDS